MIRWWMGLEQSAVIDLLFALCISKVNCNDSDRKLFCDIYWLVIGNPPVSHDRPVCAVKVQWTMWTYQSLHHINTLWHSPIWIPNQMLPDCHRGIVSYRWNHWKSGHTNRCTICFWQWHEPIVDFIQKHYINFVSKARTDKACWSYFEFVLLGTHLMWCNTWLLLSCHQFAPYFSLMVYLNALVMLDALLNFAVCWTSENK